jgi:protein phosphatase
MADETPTGGTPPEDKPAAGAEKPSEAAAPASPGAVTEAAPSAPAEASPPAAAEATPPATEAAATAPAAEPTATPASDETPTVKLNETASAPAGSGVHLDLVGRTDVGLVREHNEDSYIVIRLDDASREPDALRRHALGARGTLCVVCDGMGGAAAGEVASSMAVESLAQTMLVDVPPPPDGANDDERTALGRKLRQAARDANAQIFREARNNLARSGMGTTMTAVLFNDKHALVAQVGDSRAYVWRQGRFTQVTRDQSLVNQLLETGHITPEQAKFFEHSNVILQALGVQEEVEVQLSKVELRRGDRFVVCSDGLVGVVTDEEIGAVLGACEDPAETARILIEMANGAGGPDNISVIVAHVGGDVLPEPTEADHLEYKLWKIDPENALASVEEPTTQPGMHQAIAAEQAARAAQAQARSRPDPSAPSRNPTLELVSMAVVFGLVLGSVMTGAVIYKNGVNCHVSARQPGLSVVADGRDTGIRIPATGAEEGTPTRVKMRLRPGRHLVTLKGQGAPEGAREVEVARGQMCEIDFTEATGAQASETSESQAQAQPAPAPGGEGE